ncbi:MAG: hypothetical protein F6K39_34675 [Okeania sp. SIO3B3]|nr:hypothetical protein [Okeania sp. SIO3B3]
MTIDLARVLQHESAVARWRGLEQWQRNIRKIDVASLSLLGGALSDSHAFVRWQAGQILAAHAEGRVKLLELLDQQSAHEVWVVALDALQRVPISNFEAVLQRMLQYDDVALRRSAAEALRYHATSKSTGMLLAALQDEDLWVRRAAAYALAYLDEPDVVSALIMQLTDSSVLVQQGVVYALGALRAKAAASTFMQLLSHPDDIVRRNAAWALGRIEAADALPDLARLRNDDANSIVAQVAQQAIKTIRRPKWLPFL